jgi:hypothetical protein
MTEAEWLACTEPSKMIGALGRNPSKRKRRLFGCACCRRVWPLIPDERSRSALLAAEQFADDLVGGTELDSAKIDARTACGAQVDPTHVGRWAAGACYCVVLRNAGDAAKAWRSAASAVQMKRLAERGSSRGSPDYAAIMRQVWDEELARQADLARDIFGNPFRPVAVDPSWLTSTVVSLARGAYAERAFDRMPILADALQDAGCANADILDHCRGPGPHVRGCWALDLILGKE